MKVFEQVDISHLKYLMKEYEKVKKNNKASDNEIKETTNNYSSYLDSMGLKMPSPRYKYDHQDKTTWKYLDSIGGERNDGRFKITEVFNPEFKYNNM